MATLTLEVLPEFITVDELAEVMRVDRRTIYDALNNGDIPGAQKIGRQYRIHRDTVVDWFTSAGSLTSEDEENGRKSSLTVL